jgi:hypothetical protein
MRATRLFVALLMMVGTAGCATIPYETQMANARREKFLMLNAKWKPTASVQQEKAPVFEQWRPRGCTPDRASTMSYCQ